VSPAGLVSITGGKWTTYRKMAEDTINQAALVGGLDERPAVTSDLKLHGWTAAPDTKTPLGVYGERVSALRQLLSEHADWNQPLHPSLPYLCGEVVWAVRHEMARTVEDVLSRRLRALLLDARSSIEAAARVAKLMATAMGRDNAWEQRQFTDFKKLATDYLPPVI
jgi:glycerol-3-phosphate dehydrogenase